MASYSPLNSTERFVGWVSQPNGRGTIDIIWASTLTIGLCSWSALCLTLPALDEGKWRIFRRKLYLAGLGVVGPEFTFQLALGQWLSARRSVQQFKKSEINSWTMKHAFLADMGGFFLHAEPLPPFPLNAKQVHFLVSNGYVSEKDVMLSVKDIDDKNKREGFARILTVAQILWFLANTIGRVAQNLSVTTLELTTIAFVIPSLCTFALWTKKPSDITSPIILKLKVDLKALLEQHGQDMEDIHSRTPLEFVSRKEWPWSLHWEHFVNFIRHCGITLHPQKRPITRIPNDLCPEITSWGLVGLWAMQNIYGCIHFLGWNFEFPTMTERKLWHIASLTMITAINSYWLVDICFYRAEPWLKARLSPRLGSLPKYESGSPKWIPSNWAQRYWKGFCAGCRNNSPSHDPAFNIPMRASITVYLIAIFYLLARAYILLEDILALRWLPISAFDSVNWSDYIPHIL